GDKGWLEREEGGYFFYLSGDEVGVKQLWVYGPVGAGEARQVTDSEYGVADFVIDERGERLVYGRGREDGGHDLWLLSLVTGEERALLLCPARDCRQAVWGPDGERLIFERRGQQAALLWSEPRLWWLELATGATRGVLAEPTRPASAARFSADGSWLAYYDWWDDQLVVAEVGGERQYVIPSEATAGAVWHPSEAQLVVPAAILERSGVGTRLTLLDVETGALKDISGEFPADDWAPSWAPDGSALALARRVPGTGMGRQVVVMPAEGGGGLLLTEDVAFHYSRVQWSPSGEWLLWERRHQNGEGGVEVGIIDVGTGEILDSVTGEFGWWWP
ncbi:MAG TPA: hypothetical protein VLL52_14685, partial [Anaerolineae bacterium]|nr:hypothetical protein [Anaerolineae bacterium]